MRIGQKTHEKIIDQVRGLLNAWKNDIDLAYCKADDALSVNFKSDLKPDRGGVKVTTEIKFRPEPDIKDKTSGYVDEDQMTIFEAPKSKKVFRPFAANGYYTYRLRV